jgi:hypothetical protein
VAASSSSSSAGGGDAAASRRGRSLEDDRRTRRRERSWSGVRHLIKPGALRGRERALGSGPPYLGTGARRRSRFPCSGIVLGPQRCRLREIHMRKKVFSFFLFLAIGECRVGRASQFGASVPTTPDSYVARLPAGSRPRRRTARLAAWVQRRSRRPVPAYQAPSPR